MTRDQLESVKAFHLQSIEAIDQQLAALNKVWEPKDVERVYFVSDGMVTRSIFNAALGAHHAALRANDIHPTDEAAERELLRRQSMKPTIPVPKVGDYVYFAYVGPCGWDTEQRVWSGSPLDIYIYNQGRIKHTEEECQAWIDQFGPAWTEGVGE